MESRYLAASPFWNCPIRSELRAISHLSKTHGKQTIQPGGNTQPDRTNHSANNTTARDNESHTRRTLLSPGIRGHRSAFRFHRLAGRSSPSSVHDEGGSSGALSVRISRGGPGRTRANSRIVRNDRQTDVRGIYARGFENVVRAVRAVFGRRRTPARTYGASRLRLRFVYRWIRAALRNRTRRRGGGSGRGREYTAANHADARSGHGSAHLYAQLCTEYRGGDSRRRNRPRFTGTEIRAFRRRAVDRTCGGPSRKC